MEVRKEPVLSFHAYISYRDLTQVTGLTEIASTHPLSHLRPSRAPPNSVLRTRKQVSALPTFSCPTLLTSNLFRNPFLLIPSTLAKLHSFSGLDPCLCLGLTSLITGNITCASDFPAYLCSSSVPTTHGICI